MYEQAVQVLQGKLGDVLDSMPYDRKQMLADVAKCLPDVEKIRLSNGLYQYLLKESNPDNWGWWKGYLETVFLLHGKKGDEKKTIEIELSGKKLVLPFTDNFKDAKEFIKSLQKKEKPERER